MPRGRKRAEVAAEPWRARERNQSAVREAGKDVGIVIPFAMLESGRFHYCKIVTVSYLIIRRRYKLIILIEEVIYILFT